MEARLKKLLSNKSDIAIVELNWFEKYLEKKGNEELENELNIVALKRGVDPRYVLVTKKKIKKDFYNAIIETENEMAGKQLSSTFDGVRYKIIEDDIDAALNRLRDEKCEGVLVRQSLLGKRKKIKGLKYENMGVELIVPPSGYGIVALVERKEADLRHTGQSDAEAVMRLEIEREIIKRTAIEEENICVHAKIHRGELAVSAFVDINEGKRLLQKGSIKHRERIVSAIVEKIDRIMIK